MSTEPKDEKPAGGQTLAAGLPLGLPTGMVFGMLFGLLLDNLAIGLSLGVAFGMSMSLLFGVAIMKQKQKREGQDDAPSDEEKS
ncbi:hypothetical protein [Maricaulis sp.]|uniref:hypothetical protein n=1 Tax=Maricaulis sp. TaxID=1486257 RepID=UPI002609ADBB|nr:hypothetical protein [Maricaulis sp.]